ncbi:MAG: M14 family zinc carboxypeptidase [Candidatus Thermoplasmatota archaeon]
MREHYGSSSRTAQHLITGRSLTIFLLLLLLLSLAQLPGAYAEPLPYPSYEEVTSRLTEIAAAHPGIARLESLTTTWEGREVNALRLGTEGMPAVLIMGGHHAREPSSVVVPLRIAEFLSSEYQGNGTVRWLLDHREIWLVPLLNPDGYEYVLSTGDWSWRKNRRPVDIDSDGLPDGVGVDLNRNYVHRWGEGSASHAPTSQEYCGPYAFSENETMAIKELAEREGFSLSLSFHSYGEQVFYPWNNDLDPYVPEMESARALALEVSERNGYAAMQGVDLYPTYGDSDDYLFSTGVYPLTIELGTRFDPSEAEMEAQFWRNIEAATYLIESADDPAQAALPDWSLLVYMAGDNSLSAQALADLNEMENAMESGDVDVLVLYDGPENGDSKLYKVMHDPNASTALVSIVLSDDGAVLDPSTSEAMMSHSATLQRFVSWGMTSHPAQRTALVLWDHGAGLLKGICLDKDQWLRYQELGEALGAHHMDLIGFDLCFGAYLEVALTLNARYVVGSQAEEPEQGWDYTAVLSSLAAEPNMGADLLSSLLVESYATAYAAVGYATLSAIDLHLLQMDLLPALERFAMALEDVLFDNYTAIRQARNATPPFSPKVEDDTDLADFAGRISAEDVLPPETREAAAALVSAIESVAAARFSAWSVQHAHGISIYHPREGGYEAAYRTLSPTDTWLHYLQEFASPSQRPRIEMVEQPVARNTTGPYHISVRVTDDALDGVWLYHRTAGGTFQEMPMSLNIESGLFEGRIPGASDGTVIEYYLTAKDSDGHSAYCPEGARSGEYLSFTVSAYLDIYVESVSLPAAMRAGDDTYALVKVGNAGYEPVAGAVVTLWMTTEKEEIEAGQTHVSLQPGEIRVLNLTFIPVEGVVGILCRIAPPQGSPADQHSENDTAEAAVHLMGDGIPSKQKGIDLLTLLLLLSVAGGLAVLAISVLGAQRAEQEAGRLQRRIAVLTEVNRGLRGMGCEDRSLAYLLAHARYNLALGDLEDARAAVDMAAQRVSISGAHAREER